MSPWPIHSLILAGLTLHKSYALSHNLATEVYYFWILQSFLSIFCNDPCGRMFHSYIPYDLDGSLGEECLMYMLHMTRLYNSKGFYLILLWFILNHAYIYTIQNKPRSGNSLDDHKWWILMAYIYKNIFSCKKYTYEIHRHMNVTENDHSELGN